MNPLLARTTIIAVGVSNYNDPSLPPLPGPERDVERLKKLLVDDRSTALYSAAQFTELINPTGQELRKALIDYSRSRTASGDILIFYFSGHGVPVGVDDFGFCVRDTFIHPITTAAEPLSVVKYSDLLTTISIANAIPIVIIDACYSGIASYARRVAPVDMFDSIQAKTTTMSASKYALFCSCSDVQASIDTADGGVFSFYLTGHAAQGFPREEIDKPFLTIGDLYPYVDESVMNYSPDVTPRLYLGSQLPDLPFVKNRQYAPLEYELVNHLVCVVTALWNNGGDRTLTLTEILATCGQGAYGNHRKLSFSPWALVEDGGSSRQRRLTERGRQFARGEISVPRRVVYSPDVVDYIEAPGSPQVRIKEFS